MDIGASAARDGIPLVQQIPVAAFKRRGPWPGWWGACLTTLGYWMTMLVLMFGTLGLIAAIDLIFGLSEDDLPAAGNQRLPSVIHLGLTLSMFFAYIGGLLYSIVALRWMLGRGWTHQIGLRRLPGIFVLLTLLAMPGFLIASDLAANVATAFFDAIFKSLGLTKPESIQVNLTEQFGPYPWPLVILIVGVAPGIAEEFWCRGFLGRGLIGRHGVVAGVVLSSALFGILHLWPPAYIAATAIMGLALHFTYLMSRSLWVPVLIHTLNNSLAGLAELRVIDNRPIARAIDSFPTLLSLLSFGLLIFAGFAMWSCRGRLVNERGDTACASDPGIIVSPRYTGLQVVHSPVSGTAVLFTFVTCVALVYLVYLR